MRRKRDVLKILYIVSLLILLGVVGIRPSQAENSWTSKTPMPTQRLDSVSAVVNGKIYVIGGWVPPKGAKTNKVEVYDPATDTWTEKAPLPTKVVHTACGVVDGKIYVIGGQWGSYPGSAGFVYNPLTDTWTSIAPMPGARFGHSIGVWDGKIYVIGGDSAKNEMYDPATDTWTSKAPMPTTYRDHLGVAVVNNKIYAIGGRHGYNSNPYDLNEEYDPSINKWTTKEPMPTARAGFYELAVVDNKIYVMGGENGITDSVYQENEVYDPATDTWTTLTPLPTPRHGMSIQAVNNKIYTIGGGESAYYAWSNINEEYTPPLAANQPPDISAIPDSLSKNEGETITTSEIELATDPDGDPLTYTYSGWLSSLPYTTTYDDASTHILHVDVSDGVNPSLGKDIIITVNNVNRAPVLTPIGDKSITEANLLEFQISATDPDNDTLTYSAQDLPTGATFTNQTFSWMPSSGQAGSSQVTFIVTDTELQNSETITITVTAPTQDEEKPSDFEDVLHETSVKCYNNVFNAAKGERVLIRVELQNQSHVKLNLYNTRGKRIRELVDEEKEADIYKYYWDGRNDSGNVVGSGLYFVHIQAGDYKKTKKIVVVK